VQNVDIFVLFIVKHPQSYNALVVNISQSRNIHKEIDGKYTLR